MDDDVDAANEVADARFAEVDKAYFAKKLDFHSYNQVLDMDMDYPIQLIVSI